MYDKSGFVSSLKPNDCMGRSYETCSKKKITMAYYAFALLACD